MDRLVLLGLADRAALDPDGPGPLEAGGEVVGVAGAEGREASAFDHQDARGELFWGGFAGTQWWISPRKNTAGLIMAQRQMGFAHPFVVEFKRLAYEAVKRKS